MNEQTENISLKPKQLVFANAIINGKSNREAYILAGYSATKENPNNLDACAGKVLSNSKVAAYIELQRAKLQKSLEEKTEITREWVLNKYKEIAERCNQDIVPVLDRKGNPVMVEDKDGNMRPAFTFNAKGAVSALDGIARVQGYNATQKHETTVILKELSALAPDQLKQLAEQAN